MDYFAGSNDDGEVSETSNSDHNDISTSFSTFKLYTGFSIDGEEGDSQFSNNAGNGVGECHDTEDIGECDFGKQIFKLFVSKYLMVCIQQVTYNQNNLE